MDKRQPKARYKNLLKTIEIETFTRERNPNRERSTKDTSIMPDIFQQYVISKHAKEGTDRL